MVSFRPFGSVRRPSGRRQTAAVARMGGWCSSAVVHELNLDRFGQSLFRIGTRTERDAERARLLLVPQQPDHLLLVAEEPGVGRVPLLENHDPLPDEADRILVQQRLAGARVDRIPHLVQAEQAALHLELLVALLHRDGGCKRVVVVDPDQAVLAVSGRLADVVVGLAVFGHGEQRQHQRLRDRFGLQVGLKS